MISDLLTRRFMHAPDEDLGGAADIVETTAPEDATPEQVAAVTDATKDLAPEDVEAWLVKNGMRAFNYAGWQEEINAELAKRAKTVEPEAEDEEEFVQRKDLKAVREGAVTAAEQRLNDRTEALDALTSTLDKYRDLPVDVRQRIIRNYRTKATAHLAADIASGVVDESAKAALYDLTTSGAIKSKAPHVPSAAPAGGPKQAAGLRDQLDADQLALIKRNEDQYGMPYSDSMIKEALGL